MNIESGNKSRIGVAVKQFEGLSGVFDALDVGVCVIDLDYRIRYFNKKFQEISGRSIKDARGSLCSECFNNQECDSQTCHVKQFIESGVLDVKKLYPSNPLDKISSNRSKAEETSARKVASTTLK